MERLHKVIASKGYCSRRKAEELIAAGRVKVNNKQVKELGFKVDDNDVIKIDDKILKNEEKVYFILNKPKNIISSAKDEKGRKTVVDLIDTKERIYPIGRLDFDSSGLLLLTNDGELTQSLLHPSKEIEKVYEVLIDKILNEKEIKELEKGIKIENYLTAPCRTKIIKNTKNSSLLHITIHEGKNRQVRKMMKYFGANVLRLHRIKEANISLGNLKSGEYRKLKEFEIKRLKDFLN